MDYFQTVGELGLGSRLKRLSDVCMTEVKALYTSEGFDFEPKWFPLFSLLVQRKEVTVTSAATELNLTHPHISQLAKEMAKSKLVTFRNNPKDARSRILSLTAKGAELGINLEPLWGDIKNTVREILQESDSRLMESLEKMEKALSHKTFSLRAKAIVQDRVKSSCNILSYNSQLKSHFENLNRGWIEKFFAIEPIDIKFFKNPEKEIIKKGGEIIFAELNGKVIGTCTLLVNKGEFELAKLAVADVAKGKGIGELLSLEIVKRAKAKGAKAIKLLTNSRLIPAVKLYEKIGFKETFRGQHPKYKRCNLNMEKRLG